MPTTDPRDWSVALEFVLHHEGGHVNDPADPGGETNRGISQRAHPDLDIAHLTREDAAGIYRRDYWEKPGCQRLPWPMNLLLFDAAVQHGPRQGVRLLQASLGVTVDGGNGPRTQAAATRAARDGARFVAEHLAERGVLYAALVTADSRKARFLGGWLRRLFDLALAAAL